MPRPCHDEHAEPAAHPDCAYCRLYLTNPQYRAYWDGATWSEIQVAANPSAPVGQVVSRGSGLGDKIEQALSAVGITKEKVDRVARWLGFDSCGCGERQQRLNALGAWAMRVLTGKGREEEHNEHLERLTAELPPKKG